MAPRYKYVRATSPKCRGTRCTPPRYRLAAIPLNPVTSERGGYPVDTALRILKSAQEYAETDWHKALAKAGDVAQRAEMLELRAVQARKPEERAKAIRSMAKAVQMFSRLEDAARESGDEEAQRLAGRLARHFDLMRRRWGYRDTTWEASERSMDRFFDDPDLASYREGPQAARAREKLKERGWRWVGKHTFRRK